MKKKNSDRDRDFPGERHPASKLKEWEVLEIRAGIARGETNASLGRKFKTSPENISAIKYRRSWKHI